MSAHLSLATGKKPTTPRASPVSKCRLVQHHRHYANTANALTLGMSGEQIRLQVPSKCSESTAGSRGWPDSER